jgi:hypothetical protein
VSAEVALAKLYLEGEAVPHNCEQAQMLLLAASRKGSKAADDLLNSSDLGGIYKVLLQGGWFFTVPTHIPINVS